MFYNIIFLTFFIFGCMNNNNSSSLSLSRRRAFSVVGDEQQLLNTLEKYAYGNFKDGSIENNFKKFVLKEIFPKIDDKGLNSAVISAKDSGKRNILHFAYILGDVGLVEHIFNSGMEFIANERDDKNNTPILFMINYIAKTRKNEELAYQILRNVFNKIKREDIYGSDEDATIKEISDAILGLSNVKGELTKTFIDISGDKMSEEHANLHLLYFAEMENVELVRYILNKTKAKASSVIYAVDRKKQGIQQIPVGPLLKYLLSKEIYNAELLSLIFEKGKSLYLSNRLTKSDAIYIANKICEHTKQNNTNLIQALLEKGIGKMVVDKEKKKSCLKYFKEIFVRNSEVKKILN